MKHHLKQLIPSETCLACDVCCRYPDRQSLMVPVFSNAERAKAIELGLSKNDFPLSEENRGFRIRPKPLGECYRCPAFEPTTHECQIYPEQPFDCQLYPFLLMFDSNKQSVQLVIDRLCPYIQSHENDPVLKDYAGYLVDYLSQRKMIQWICQNQNLIGEHQDSAIYVTDLPLLSQALIPSPIQRGLRPLRLEDFARFKVAFEKRKPTLSCEHFFSHYLWSDVLRYYWTEIRSHLCLFAEQDRHLFMPIPPIGGELDVEIVQQCFDIMNFWNRNREVSRIAGLRKEDLATDNGDGSLKDVSHAPRGTQNISHGKDVSHAPRGTQNISHGTQNISHSHALRGNVAENHPQREPSLVLVEHEYLYDRESLVSLKGNRYKHKRASCNTFLRTYQPNFRPFRPSDLESCLKLYQKWLIGYAQRHPDPHSIEMAKDSRSVHEKALREYEKLEPLGLIGRVVEIGQEIAGYTFGFELNPGTFYILFEITDLEFKGPAQYIFREFCREMDSYRYIHAGGDSGLSSLKAVKLSYHPVKQEAVYQVTKMQVSMDYFIKFSNRFLSGIR